jgi:hypothetical protein
LEELSAAGRDNVNRHRVVTEGAVERRPFVGGERDPREVVPRLREAFVGDRARRRGAAAQCDDQLRSVGAEPA